MDYMPYLAMAKSRMVVTHHFTNNGPHCNKDTTLHDQHAISQHWMMNTQGWLMADPARIKW
jgi:hypothetical protein